MGMSISVKTTIDPRVVGTQFEQFRRDVTERSLDILENTVRLEMLNRGFKVEGDAIESFEYTAETVGDLIKFLAGSDDVAVSVLEYGARPADGGVVNFDEIYTWVKAKGIRPSYGTQKQFAWAIAKAIGRRGQPLHGGLKRPFNAAQKKASRKIEREWETSISVLVGKLNAK